MAERRKKQEEFYKHLSDPSVADHADQKLNGWWTDWVKNRLPLIEAHYQSRNISWNGKGGAGGAQGITTGMTAHPADYTAKESYSMNRTVAICERERGQPKPGDIVIIRAERTKGEPQFWVAKIRAYRDITLADRELEQKVKEVASKRKKNEGIPWPEQCEGLIHSEEPGSRSRNANRSSGGGARGKDQLATVNEVFDFNNILVDWFNYITSTAKRKRLSKNASKKKAKRSNESGDDESYYDDDTPLSELQGHELEEEKERDQEPQASADIDDDEDMGVTTLTPNDIEPFRNYRYAQLEKQANLEVSRWYEVGHIICWGPESWAFTSNKTLKEAVWKLIVQDLTQDQ
jgi:hypothetical protein